MTGNRSFLASLALAAHEAEDGAIQAQMQKMQALMAQNQAESDPAKHQQLMNEHM